MLVAVEQAVVEVLVIQAQVLELLTQAVAVELVQIILRLVVLA
jgi:hypothetical protein